MNFLRKSDVGLMSNFCGRKPVPSIGDASPHYPNIKNSAFILRNALIANFVVAVAASICCVLTLRRLTQVAPAVVIRIAVDVVNSLFRPLTRHIQPRKAVGFESSSIDVDVSGALSIGASNCSHWGSIRDGLYPSDDSSLWIIMHKFTQFCLSEWIANLIHEMGRPSARIRLAIKSLLGALTPSRLAFVPRIAA